MTLETRLVIVTPSASRARVLPGLLKLPPEVKIETIIETETWRPDSGQPVVIDLASSPGVLKKLVGVLKEAAPPPVLMIGEPWQLDKELAAQLGPEMIFAPLPLSADHPALEATRLLEGFDPARARPAATPMKPPEQAPRQAEVKKPIPTSPDKTETDASVDEVVERLEMLLGDEAE